jgi:protein-S-isoprenylcysteine O-methyltransferase Ste14
MENTENKVNLKHNKHKDHGIHVSLSYSYLIHLFVLIVGVILDLLFPVKIFHDSVMIFIGTMSMVFASILILWAQLSSNDLLAKEVVNPLHFCRGPYCYTRTPTHWGLFLAVMGFGFIINSFFVIVLTFLSFFITKFTFVKKQEEELEKKYGDAYREYKKIVKF